MNEKEKPPVPVREGKRPGLPPLLLRRNAFSHLWYIAWSSLTTGVIMTVTLAVRWPLGVNPVYPILVFAGLLGGIYLIEAILRAVALHYRRDADRP